jgi:site-specific DNA-methyltransferase (adenine-specific)
MSIVLSNSDCIAGMDRLPDGIADLIICDAPYGVKYVSGMSDRWKHQMIANDEASTVKFEAYRRFPRLMSDNSYAVCFCSFKSYAEDYMFLKQMLTIKNALIWHKSGGSMGDIRASFSTDYEIAILCARGSPHIRGKRDGAVIEGFLKCNSNTQIHPTEKPISLMRYLIEKLSDAGDMVLDPFAGSCCVGAACQSMGRDYIGYELDKTFYDAAMKRLQGKSNEQIEEIEGGQQTLF